MSSTPDLTLVLPPDLTPALDANGVKTMDESQLRSLTQGLLSQIQQQGTELTLRQAQIDALTHEVFNPISQDEWVGAAGVFVRCAQPFADPP